MDVKCMGDSFYTIDWSEISATPAKHFSATNYWVWTYLYPIQVIHSAFKAEYASAFLQCTKFAVGLPYS